MRTSIPAQPSLNAHFERKIRNAVKDVEDSHALRLKLRTLRPHVLTDDFLFHYRVETVEV